MCIKRNTQRMQQEIFLLYFFCIGFRIPADWCLHERQWTIYPVQTTWLIWLTWTIWTQWKNLQSFLYGLRLIWKTEKQKIYHAYNMRVRAHCGCMCNSSIKKKKDWYWRVIFDVIAKARLEKSGLVNFFCNKKIILTLKFYESLLIKSQ